MRKSKNASALNLNFTYTGPDNIGGRTRGLVIDVNAPTTVYAGSAGGGVWKSQSNGTSWVQMTVNGGLTEAIQVSCLLQTPAGTLYAGTGESWYTPDGTVGRGGFYGTGLYKSTDRAISHESMEQKTGSLSMNLRFTRVGYGLQPSKAYSIAMTNKMDACQG